MRDPSGVWPVAYHPGVVPDEVPTTCTGCGARAYDTCTWDDGHCDDCQEGGGPC